MKLQHWWGFQPGKPPQAAPVLEFQPENMQNGGPWSAVFFGLSTPAG